MGTDRVAAAVCVAGLFGLGLVALIRAHPKDIPEVVRELTNWWYR
jgi:hypothetical protein